MGKHGTDWPALKLEFINGSMTYEQLAEQYRVSLAAMKKRGAMEKWVEERHQKSRGVTEKAQASILQKRIETLQEINESDLTLAKNIRVLIGRRMSADEKLPLSARDIRALAGAAAEAQRIARLALGVNTESLEVAGQGGGPIQQEHTLTDAQRAAADEILDYFVNGKQTSFP